MNHRQTKIAIRKFFAVPVTIILSTLGAVMAAYYAGVELLDSEGEYLFAVIIGLFFGSILALALKSFMKSRGKFQFDYIFASMVTVLMVVSSISFIFHLLIVSLA